MRIETAIEEGVVEAAKVEDWHVRKLSWFGRRNAPDHFFAKNGRIVLMEFKSPSEELRDSQSFEIEQLIEHGVEVHTVKTITQGKRILGLRDV